jgi:hypothetical protein
MVGLLLHSRDTGANMSDPDMALNVEPIALELADRAEKESSPHWTASTGLILRSSQ